ncbi:hypothetical protein [Bradyrhizobium sp. SZCCHNPS1003]|uniref:hypothetical protein n=1 Tax=Bradyrhizobium sp. SZCCHNPS1003 TaxID=3057330 RepID=UPI0028E7B165|nr:hypothetical protein [Bradyrhizobium sp. SZCCHNPS1003]
MPTNDIDAHGQVAWSWHPDADAKSVLMRKGAVPMTVAKKPGAPGRTRSSRSNHRAGNAGMSRLNLWFLPPAFFSAGGPWVRPAPGIPRALCMFARDELITGLGHQVPRECAAMSIAV